MKATMMFLIPFDLGLELDFVGPWEVFAMATRDAPTRAVHLVAEVDLRDGARAAAQGHELADERAPAGAMHFQPRSPRRARRVGAVAPALPRAAPRHEILLVVSTLLRREVIGLYDRRPVPNGVLDHRSP